MRIAVLALQGAFAEHRQKLAQLGVDSFEVRQLKDWDQPKDGLIIPGGESTTQAKLLNVVTFARKRAGAWTSAGSCGLLRKPFSPLKT